MALSPNEPGVILSTREPVPGETPELWEAFRDYCVAEYARWKQAQPRIHMFIWNVNWTFDQIEERHRRWIAHIDPLSEAWWKARGFRWIGPFPFDRNSTTNEPGLEPLNAET